MVKITECLTWFKKRGKFYYIEKWRTIKVRFRSTFTYQYSKNSFTSIQYFFLLWFISHLPVPVYHGWQYLSWSVFWTTFYRSNCFIYLFWTHRRAFGWYDFVAFSVRGMLYIVFLFLYSLEKNIKKLAVL